MFSPLAIVIHEQSFNGKPKAPAGAADTVAFGLPLNEKKVNLKSCTTSGGRGDSIHARMCHHIAMAGNSTKLPLLPRNFGNSWSKLAACHYASAFAEEGKNDFSVVGKLEAHPTQIMSCGIGSAPSTPTSLWSRPP